MTDRKIVLVTGGNNGIGLFTCRLFAAQPNYHCVLASRSESKGQEAIKSIQDSDPNASISLVQLDITSDESIANAVKAVEAKHDHLDVLINNAGICPTDFTRASLRSALETNAISPALVSEAFMPLLQESASPRVIYVSSVLGSIALQSNPDHEIPHYREDYKAYRASKAALNMLVAYDAFQYDGKIKVFAYCPGYVVTDLAGERESKEKQGIAKQPDDSARGLLAIAEGKRDGEKGKFLYEEQAGTVYPW